MLELILLAIAPSLFIFLYIYQRDCYEREPLHLLAWIFFLGAVAVIVAGLIELPFPEGVIGSALVAPVVEETLKFLVVYLAIYRHPEFDEPMDGIVYATAAGLGFATVENILYVLEGGIAVGIVRAIASVPGHVVFSCIWGFALGTAKFRPEKERAKIILFGLAGAILMHGIFNFSLEVFEVSGFLLILLIILPFGWWMTCRNIKSAHADPASACSAINLTATLPSTTRINPEGITLLPPLSPQSPPPSDPAGPVSDETGLNYQQHFCTRCGAPLKEGMRFCENCGKEH